MILEEGVIVDVHGHYVDVKMEKVLHITLA